MAAIVESVEIARRPMDVFSYATDFSRYPEWQGGVEWVRVDEDGPPAVGSKALVTRRVGPRRLPGAEAITELSPPRSWTVRAVSDPVRATAMGTIEPIAGGERSRVTIALEFKGRGIGRLLVPLVVRRQARRQLPINERQLKRVLEHGV
jgi:Polyketide cyclase / dehydrase and lipid transport